MSTRSPRGNLLKIPRCVRYIQQLLTRPLRRPLRRLLLQDDAGAIGILVAALLGGGLLLGLGAMVIDVGQLYQERAELQNGADAAALAVAKLCIEPTCTSTNALSTAQTYAGENTKDGVAGVDTVCGTRPEHLPHQHRRDDRLPRRAVLRRWLR